MTMAAAKKYNQLKAKMVAIEAATTAAAEAAEDNDDEQDNHRTIT
jgi:hypothetical protein